MLHGLVRIVFAEQTRIDELSLATIHIIHPQTGQTLDIPSRVPIALELLRIAVITPYVLVANERIVAEIGDLCDVRAQVVVVEFVLAITVVYLIRSRLIAY